MCNMKTVFLMHPIKNKAKFKLVKCGNPKTLSYLMHVNTSELTILAPKFKYKRVGVENLEHLAHVSSRFK